MIRVGTAGFAYKDWEGIVYPDPQPSGFDRLVFTSEVGTPLDKDNVTKRQLRRVVEASGLTVKLRFHDLRHIAASLALGQGTPITVVSEMLGHADPATTLRVYAHAIPGAQRQAADALEAALAV